MQDPAPLGYQSECGKVKRRIFFYDDNINHDRRDRYFKKVKGNRSIHAVMSTDGACTLSSRCLSCYCDPCLECNYEACENSNYVSGWEDQDLEQEDGHHRTAVTRSDVSTTIEVIKDLAAKHAIVAIATAVRGEDYYLLQKQAIVHAATIRYICPELNENEHIYDITEELHLDILESLNGF